MHVIAQISLNDRRRGDGLDDAPQPETTAAQQVYVHTAGCLSCHRAFGAFRSSTVDGVMKSDVVEPFPAAFADVAHLPVKRRAYDLVWPIGRRFRTNQQPFAGGRALRAAPRGPPSVRLLSRLNGRAPVARRVVAPPAAGRVSPVPWWWCRGSVTARGGGGATRAGTEHLVERLRECRGVPDARTLLLGGWGLTVADEHSRTAAGTSTCSGPSNFAPYTSVRRTGFRRPRSAVSAGCRTGSCSTSRSRVLSDATRGSEIIEFCVCCGPWVCVSVGNWSSGELAVIVRIGFHRQICGQELTAVTHHRAGQVEGRFPGLGITDQHVVRRLVRARVDLVGSLGTDQNALLVKNSFGSSTWYLASISRCTLNRSSG